MSETDDASAAAKAYWQSVARNSEQPRDQQRAAQDVRMTERADRVEEAQLLRRSLTRRQAR